MNKSEEFAYLLGKRAASVHMLHAVMGDLGYKSTEHEVAALVSEREAAIAVLRQLCAEFGDNEWGDRLHLADVIEKHLGRHLYRDKA